jgi:hypothetical protein
VNILYSDEGPRKKVRFEKNLAQKLSIYLWTFPEKSNKICTNAKFGCGFGVTPSLNKKHFSEYAAKKRGAIPWFASSACFDNR